MLLILRAVDCGNTVQANAVLSGTPSNYQQGATTNIVCNTSYTWASGENATSAKSATCQNINGNGVWTSNDTCIGAQLMYFSILKYCINVSCCTRVYVCLLNMAFLLILMLINAETCPSSLSSLNMNFTSGSAPSNISVGTIAQLNCSSGFDWSDGNDGATSKTATCLLVNGVAVWSTTESCFGTR